MTRFQFMTSNAANADEAPIKTIMTTDEREGWEAGIARIVGKVDLAIHSENR